MRLLPASLALALTIVLIGGAHARGPLQPPRTPKAAALFDVTGYWVSVVTEDWRFRMVTPQKGDFTGIPLNPEGRKLASAWDPAKESSEEACKSYGAPSIMRVPARIHITWQDDQTLKIETDAGSQVRLLSFGAARDRRKLAGHFESNLGLGAGWTRPGSHRLFEGSYNQPQGRILTKERSALQRELDTDRILRSGQRAGLGDHTSRSPARLKTPRI